MDAASTWPVRQIRRHAGKVARIISVVKIKMMREARRASETVSFSLLRSNNGAFGKEGTLIFVHF
jgi:predicted deacetylase